MTSQTPILSCQNLVKKFGGISATNDVSFDLLSGEIHAIIGPNGAGKTTLVGQISGEIKPDGGRILFNNLDISNYSIHRRALIGMARSFQITSIFLDATVLKNVAICVQAHQGHSFKFWSSAMKDTNILDKAFGVLESIGLKNRAKSLASELSHGERRQLEMAMVLAAEPEVMLLDEPMAGMGREETSEMIERLKEYRKGRSILLVEHDMDAVFALADRISVLVYGQIIATGLPDDIRSNKAVEKAYLGEGI